MLVLASSISHCPVPQKISHPTTHARRPTIVGAFPLGILVQLPSSSVLGLPQEASSRPSKHAESRPLRCALIGRTARVGRGFPSASCMAFLREACSSSSGNPCISCNSPNFSESHLMIGPKSRAGSTSLAKKHGTCCRRLGDQPVTFALPFPLLRKERVCAYTARKLPQSIEL